MSKTGQYNLLEWQFVFKEETNVCYVYSVC